MANTNVFEIEVELETAKNLSVLINWIERARNLAEIFDHLLKSDEKLKERCRKNNWYPVSWEEHESEALVQLAIVQENSLRNVIALKNKEAAEA